MPNDTTPDVNQAAEEEMPASPPIPIRPEDKERQRLEEVRTQREQEGLAWKDWAQADWKHWGPYISERAWGTVREDYSADGSAWDYLPHDWARSKAYRWNEDGLGGLCDYQQRLCFALALWNGRDPILKERAFGLSGPQGNHGEDVKEYYFHLDNTPTHSYMKMLYKYPQAAFPYADLVETNGRRSKHEPEYELLDTGVFRGQQVLGRVHRVRQGRAGRHPHQDHGGQPGAGGGDPAPAPHPLAAQHLDVATRTPGRDNCGKSAPQRPILGENGASAPPELAGGGMKVVEATHPSLATRHLLCEGAPALLFTENETNNQRLYGAPNATPHVKDAFHEHLVHGVDGAVSPTPEGTKMAAHQAVAVGAGQERSHQAAPDGRRGDGGRLRAGVRAGLRRPQALEADIFYEAIGPPDLSEDARDVMRQAFAGMLWSKQFYKYDVSQWLDGDPGMPPPPASRETGRNHDWRHVNCADLISMPDTWEYPWFAAWDLAFHCIPFAVIDPQFAKEQLDCCCATTGTSTRTANCRRMNGRSATSTRRCRRGRPGASTRSSGACAGATGDTCCSWKRSSSGCCSTSPGGSTARTPRARTSSRADFWGLDNIGVFDRNQPSCPPAITWNSPTAPAGWRCTALNLLDHRPGTGQAINPAYEDVASKFWEHFLYIANAMTNLGDQGRGSLG